RYESIQVAGLALSILFTGCSARNTVTTEPRADSQTHRTVTAVNINPVAGLGTLAGVVGIGLFSQSRGHTPDHWADNGDKPFRLPESGRKLKFTRIFPDCC